MHLFTTKDISVFNSNYFRTHLGLILFNYNLRKIISKLKMNSQTAAKPISESGKKVTCISNTVRESIVEFIQNCNGSDCKTDLIKKFWTYHIKALFSIYNKQLATRMQFQKKRCNKNAKEYLKMYLTRSKATPNNNNNILLQIAREEDLGPVMLCRAILTCKYPSKKVSECIKNPESITDCVLKSNVIQCIINDKNDGPQIDIKRRLAGERYELKLQQMANAAGMEYYTENALRGLGYKKTPDLKLKKPVMYKGVTIYWIESKANFADEVTHTRNIKQQLQPYCEIFGVGIVIYWYGYDEAAAELNKKYKHIILLDDFPKKQDIKL